MIIELDRRLIALLSDITHTHIERKFHCKHTFWTRICTSVRPCIRNASENLISYTRWKRKFLGKAHSSTFPRQPPSMASDMFAPNPRSFSDGMFQFLDIWNLTESLRCLSLKIFQTTISKILICSISFAEFAGYLLLVE